ncbi:MAG: hypothetical protein RJA10_434 [Pseudomonadota bacterium]|jgi:putative cardiolipin synthase
MIADGPFYRSKKANFVDPREPAVGTVDRGRLQVDCVNLDARSALLNTELGVTIDGPVVAEQAVAVIGGNGFGSRYSVALAADQGSVDWHAIDPVQGSRWLLAEPGLNGWLAFKLWLQSLVLAEESL